MCKWLWDAKSTVKSNGGFNMFYVMVVLINHLISVWINKGQNFEILDSSFL